MTRILLLLILSLTFVVGSKSGFSQSNINSDSTVQSSVVSTSCPISLTEFTSDGTFNLPECAGGTGLVLAEIQGGGGCGNGGGGGLGGGGGGSGQLIVALVFVTGAVTVTVPAACTAGSGRSGAASEVPATAGADGGNVLFGNVIARGGKAIGPGGLNAGGESVPTATAGGAGATVNTPIQQFGLRGDRGLRGGTSSATVEAGASSSLFAGGSATTAPANAGGGAASEFGSGGSGGTSGTPTGGNPAAGSYGAGAGGGYGAVFFNNGADGGVGARGIVRVVFLK